MDLVTDTAEVTHVNYDVTRVQIASENLQELLDCEIMEKIETFQVRVQISLNESSWSVIVRHLYWYSQNITTFCPPCWIPNIQPRVGVWELKYSNPPLVQLLCSLSFPPFIPLPWVYQNFEKRKHNYYYLGDEPIVLLKLWKVFPACYYISPIPKKKPSKNCFQSYVTVTLGPSLESPGHFSSQEGHSKNLEPTYDYREIFTKFFIWTEIFFVQGVSGACFLRF